jgi:hypothetical protein
VLEIDMDERFQNALSEANACSGLTLSTTGRTTRSDFKVLLRYNLADTPEMEEEWVWSLFDTRRDPKGEFRATGAETSAQSAVTNMCTEVWENFNSSGGSRGKN